jgi:hypothetical protein
MQVGFILSIPLVGNLSEEGLRTSRNDNIGTDLTGLKEAGGEAGIRTLGGVAPTTIFETVPFNRSGTSPRIIIIIYAARN